MSKKYSYDEAKMLLANKDLILLDKEYINCKQPLLCLDKEGYKVLISIDNLNNKKIKGLRVHKTNPYSIENINHFAELNNLPSRCIEEKYINSKERMKFKCNCNNEFYTTWDCFHSLHKIKCDECSNNPLYKKDYLSVKNELEKFGYYLDLDEDSFEGVTITPLICHDKYGYKYRITYDEILRGKKPFPVSKNNIFSIENINTFLKNNNKAFKCISDNYLGRDYLLEFECIRCGEHIFEKWHNMSKSDNPSRSILICPKCDGRNESIHALVLKQVFKHYYPDTIEEDKSCVNPLTGYVLPTDIVNHNLKIAIEIQSEWHDRDYQKVKDKIKKDFWVNKGYSFYSPDIRDYSVLGMCQLFFNIDKLPDYINYEYSNKLNIKKAQELLNSNISPKEIAKILNTNIHVIYDAIGADKLHYSDTYIRKDYTPIVEVDENNNVVCFYQTIKDAAETYNLKPGSLTSALRRGRHFFGGHIWYYADEINQ